MAKITVLSFGRKLESFERSWVELYLNRLKRYVKLTWHRFETKSAWTEKAMAEQIEKKMPKNAKVILLDEGGEAFSTEKLKKWVESMETQSVPNLCFIIGESYGFSSEIKEKYPFHVSLSKLTFSHKLALLVLFEQLYRVYSWKAGSPYHHE